MNDIRVLVEKKSPIAIVTLNEPEKRNPFSPTMVRQLNAALVDLAADETIVVVIFTGAGPAFSGGADLREMRKASPLEDRSEYEHILTKNRLVWNFPKVTIAAVNGFALGGGAALVAWSDLAIMDESATIGYPEVKAGVAAATVIPSLQRVIGRKAMNELLYTGRAVSAAEAHRLGLVNRVVSKGTALAAATELALEIAKNEAHALAFTKEVVRTTTDMEYSKAIQYARDVRVISRLHPKFQGRIDKYLSKDPVQTEGNK